MPVNRGRRIVLQLDDQSFEGFEIRFDATKTVKSSPRNKARIDIFNISEEVYENAVDRKRDLVVRLYAGYEIPGLVFTGNPVKNGVQFARQGPDRILTIEAQDGYRAYQTSRLNLTLDKDNLDLYDLAAEAALSMGLPVGAIDLGDSNVSLSQGLSYLGPTSTLLDRIAASTGADWSIQDGALQILPRNKARRANGPLYSTELRNILEYPKFTDEGIKLDVFLDSSILPGDRFVIRTGEKRYDGIYKALTVQHSGELFGQNFTTSIEGRPWVEATVPAAAPPPKKFTDRVFGGLLDPEVLKVLQQQEADGLNLWTKRSE